MRKVLWIALAFIALGGYVCWQVNGPAYAMRRAIRPGMTVAQVLDSGSGYYSCHFYSDAHPDATGDFPSFTIRSAKDSPVSLLGLELSGGPKGQELAEPRRFRTKRGATHPAVRPALEGLLLVRRYAPHIELQRHFGPDGRVVAISKLGLSD